MHTKKGSQVWKIFSTRNVVACEHTSGPPVTCSWLNKNQRQQNSCEMNTLVEEIFLIFSFWLLNTHWLPPLNFTFPLLFPPTQVRTYTNALNYLNLEILLVSPHLLCLRFAKQCLMNEKMTEMFPMVTILRSDTVKNIKWTLLIITNWGTPAFHIYNAF